MDFEWDEVNIRHLKRHKIAPVEAEQVIRIESIEMGVQHHPTEDRLICVGCTATGRLLTIIYTMRGKRVRVVTGYPATRRQQRIFFEGE